MEKYKIYSGGEKPAESPKPPARPYGAARPHNATTRQAIKRSHGAKVWGPIFLNLIRGKSWRDILLAKLGEKYLDPLDRLDRP